MSKLPTTLPPGSIGIPRRETVFLSRLADGIFRRRRRQQTDSEITSLINGLSDQATLFARN